MKNFNEICENLIANGAKKIEGLKVVGIKFENFKILTLYFDNDVEAIHHYYDADNDENVYYCSHDKYIKIAVDTFEKLWIKFGCKRPTITGTRIDIIQQKLQPLQEYTSPFLDEGNARVFTHEEILNYIVNIYC